MVSRQNNDNSCKLNFYFDDSNFQDSATFLRSTRSCISTYNTESLNNLLAEVSSPSLEPGSRLCKLRSLGRTKIRKGIIFK